MPAPRRARIFFYVQHLLGIGHLARASRIATALVEMGFAVTMVTGGGAVPGFPGAGVEVVSLPPIRARDIEFSALVDDEENPIDNAFKQKRREALLAALRATRPDIVITEAYPFGRRQMRFELIPLLQAADAMQPRPLIVSSIRDILQENRKPGRAEETCSIIERYFDLVLVHGDPQFARLEDSFSLAARIADKIVYTGLVAPPGVLSAKDGFDVVVSCGGGAAAGHLLAAAIEAASRLQSRLPRWCIIAGPNQRQAPTGLPSNVELFAFRDDFPALLAKARLSISQAGYNTVCDILVAGCLSVLVPFAGSGETEQTLRAGRLAKLGLAETIPEPDLSAGALMGAIDRALASPSALHFLNLDGAHGTARILQSRLESYSQAPATTL
jgi:predicted glycosyltransferase